MSHSTGRELTWFGSATDVTDRAYFAILTDDRTAVYPDWESEAITSTRHYVGTNVSDRFWSG